MLKFTLRDLWEARQALANLAGMKLPAAASFKMFRTFRKLNTELEQLSKAWDELATRYGRPSGNNTYQIREECQAEWRREVDALMLVEVEVNADPFSAKIFSDENRLSIADCAVLEPFFHDV